METHLRSVTKGMSWRVIATSVTTIVVWLISGEVSMALLAGLSDSLIKVGLFWWHERVWQTVAWGRQSIQQEGNFKHHFFMKNVPGNTWVESSS